MKQILFHEYGGYTIGVKETVEGGIEKYKIVLGFHDPSIFTVDKMELGNIRSSELEPGEMMYNQCDRSGVVVYKDKMGKVTLKTDSSDVIHDLIESDWEIVDEDPVELCDEEPFLASQNLHVPENQTSCDEFAGA